MLLRILLASVAGATLVCAQDRNSQIVGQVRDERQRPVNGARVDAYLLPESGAKVKPFRASALTAPNGTFKLSVPSGVFRVCVQLRRTELLDPCTWSAVPPRASVPANRTVQLPPIVLKRGYPLSVRLEDAQGLLLVQDKGKRAAGQVIVGVSAPNGMFLPMPVRGRSATARDHQLFVPRDTALRVSMHSRGFTLADESGAAVDAAKGHQFSAKLAGERSRRRFVFRVTGLRPEGGGK